jgi:hypothetical protein
MKAEVRSQQEDGRPKRLLSWHDASAKLQERSLDQEKKESRCGVNAEFDAEKRGCRGEIDVASCAELFDPVNHEFETRSLPDSLVATLSALPSMSLIASAPFFLLPSSLLSAVLC